MFEKTPEDTFRAYERFLKKENFRKAYQCLERLLRDFPEDEQFLEEIIEMCLSSWHRPDKAKKWLIQLTKIRTFWVDYLLFSRVYAELRNIPRAKECLKKAKELCHHFPNKLSNYNKKAAKELLSGARSLIKYYEWNIRIDVGHSTTEETDNKKIQAKTKTVNQPTITLTKHAISSKAPLPLKEPSQQSEESIPQPKTTTQKAVEIPSYPISIKVSPLKQSALKMLETTSFAALQEIKLLIDFERIKIQGGFDELLCLNSLFGIEQYWYQIETVKKVLKHFHGRVLLCDEVGLGKTIEAGMLIKEYLIRQIVKNVLILTPPSLVSQWKEEMQAKFDLRFITSDDLEFIQDIRKFWETRFIIASIHTAKSKKNLPFVTDHFYDIVVIDEAHHLRNRTTQSWKLVNCIHKKFLFLLTATPIQNNLIELFNLITLLKPGQFKTERIFRKEFLTRGDVRRPINKEKLRGLLKDVMIRNTRSVIDLKLPKRFATTLRLQPTQSEKTVYEWVNEYLRNNGIRKPTANLLLREAGSSPFALRKSLSNIHPTEEIKKIMNFIDNFEDIAKGAALINILTKNPEEKKIIFTQYFKSMDYITALLTKHNIPYVMFRGDMASSDKNFAITRFKEDIPVLVSTESGGEGRNIQFCNTIINFDLPWNPMRIEQRIGRLHRIGQKKDVFIFNLSVRGTIEDYIIDILDNKINMFEMVIGEIEPILGELSKDQDFEEIITEIWLRSKNKDNLENNFEQFGNELVTAKKEYLRAKAFDEEIFGEDYEI